MKIAVAQMVSTDNIQANQQVVARFVGEAAQAKAQCIFFPENVLIMGDQFSLSEYINSENLIETWLKPLAKQHSIAIHMGSLPRNHRPDGQVISEQKLRASQCWIDEQGREIARYDKIHLFDAQVNDAQGAYRESDTFEPGHQPKLCDFGGFRWGLSICYDLRFGRLYDHLRNRGAEVFVVPAAFTQLTGEAHWLVLLRARAIEHQCYVVAANQGGQHSEQRSTFGHSVVIDPWGRIVAMKNQGEGLIFASLDREQLESIRQSMPVHQHKKSF